MPTVGVHALILNDNQEVLLVKKSYVEKEWAVPGGVMEDHESISAAIQREVLEETGYQVEVGELIAVASRPRTDDVIIVTAGKIIAKTDLPPDPKEISAVAFFSMELLPSPIKPEVRQLLKIFKAKSSVPLLEI